MSDRMEMLRLVRFFINPFKYDIILLSAVQIPTFDNQVSNNYRFHHSMPF